MSVARIEAMMGVLRPVESIEQVRAYAVKRPQGPIELYLHGNEGPAPGEGLVESLAGAGGEVMRAYPGDAYLRSVIGEQLGVSPARVFVGAGADEAIDRICRAMLGPGRSIVLPEPTFVMFRHYAGLAGARVVSVPWSEGGSYPTREVISAVDEATRVIVIVSPNNPTGAVATEEDLREVAEAAPGALVVVDHAYVEFSEHDLSEVAAEYENVVVLRTLSKAHGLAGLRVGFAVGGREVIGWLKRAGGPFSVSGPSLYLAAERLRDPDHDLAEFVGRVRVERRELEGVLEGYGLEMSESEGNFVFGRHPRADWLREALAGMGVLVRGFPGAPGLRDALRITCPGDRDDFELLRHALDSVLSPQAVLFDLDGVLADVSKSYRRTIVETVRRFGGVASEEDVAKVKAAGDANNDWVVTKRLLAARGFEVSLDEVREVFESIYQGDPEAPGLRRTEGPLVEVGFLERLREQYRVGIVTGRPARDAERFLGEQGMMPFIDAMVCMEDAPAKPDPAPVKLLLERLGVERAWMVGDTPDDVVAARGAKVLALGVVAPGDDRARVKEALLSAGVARVLEELVPELEELLR